MSGGILRGVIAKDNPVLTELQKHAGIPGASQSLAEMGIRSRSLDNGRQARRWICPARSSARTLSQDLARCIHSAIIVTLVSPASLRAGAAGSPRLQTFCCQRISFIRDVRFRLRAHLRRSQGRPRAAGRRSAAGNGPRGAFERTCSTRPRLQQRIAAIAGPGFEVKDWTKEERSRSSRRCNWRNLPTSWS